MTVTFAVVLFPVNSNILRYRSKNYVNYYIYLYSLISK